jgi:hypothetical protein
MVVETRRLTVKGNDEEEEVFVSVSYHEVDLELLSIAMRTPTH